MNTESFSALIATSSLQREIEELGIPAWFHGCCINLFEPSYIIRWFIEMCVAVDIFLFKIANHNGITRSNKG